MYGDIYFESKFRPEDASKLKSGMKSACTIGNRERWRVGGKGEGWMIERALPTMRVYTQYRSQE